MVAIAAAALGVAGCGNESGSGRNDGGSGGNDGGGDVEGTWVLQSGGCTTLFTFSGSSYESHRSCFGSPSPIGDTFIGVEIQRGTFVIAGAELRFTPRESSCPAARAITHATFAVEEMTLTMTIDGRSALVLSQTTLEYPRYANPMGCYDSSGSQFERHDLVQVGS
jgi:hypothetical protein